jgi:hypothetical protein
VDTPPPQIIKNIASETTPSKVDISNEFESEELRLKNFSKEESQSLKEP